MQTNTANYNSSISGYRTVEPRRGIYEIEKLYNIVSTFGGIIAGGYARYCASPRKNPMPSNDIDVFFPSHILYAAFINKYKRTFFYNCNKLYESSSAITISPTNSSEFSHIRKIQFINPQFSGLNILDCINYFDFTICRAAILDLDTIIVDDNFIDHEINNVLIAKFIKNPIGFFSRLLKYNSMGYNIPPSEILKMFEAWDNLKENEKLTLSTLMKNNDIPKLSNNDIGLDYDLNQNIENNLYKKLIRFIPQLEKEYHDTTAEFPF